VRLAPLGSHVAFEPIPGFASKLTEEFPNVTVHHAAVGNVSGVVAFEYAPDRPAVSTLRAHAITSGERTEQLSVPALRLDDILEAPPDLIKIDVEGAEEGVSRGGMRTIAEHRPTLILEHGRPARAFGTRPETIHELLVDAGLRIFDLDGNGPYSRNQLVESWEADRRWNYVAH
jgi:FkbM family methyltransferase